MGRRAAAAPSQTHQPMLENHVSNRGVDMDYLASAKEMRSAAWAELIASPAFKAFRAADNMVVELGSPSVMLDLSTPSSATKPIDNVGNGGGFSRSQPRVRTPDGSVRLTQGDAAEVILKEVGPMGIIEIIKKAKERGAAVGGLNPTNNFRSAMSKDKRFYSFRHNSAYLWWLTGVPLPEGWGEAADPDLLDAAASPNSNQEGGDGHGPATT